jgi:hypothetical protein
LTSLDKLHKGDPQIMADVSLFVEPADHQPQMQNGITDSMSGSCFDQVNWNVLKLGLRLVKNSCFYAPAVIIIRKLTKAAFEESKPPDSLEICLVKWNIDFFAASFLRVFVMDTTQEEGDRHQ